MQLNVNDIAAVVQMIDIVTARGAFRGDELSQVGALRDKYVAFVKATQDAQAAEQAVDNSAEVE